MSAPVYAVTRRRDPTSGEALFDGNRWATSPSPMVEVVLMVLRTPLGANADVTLGVDWRRVDKLGTGAAATAKAAIEEALRFLVASGQIARLAVEAEVDARRGALLYSVSFTDPRLARRPTIRGEL